MSHGPDAFAYAVAARQVGKSAALAAPYTPVHGPMPADLYAYAYKQMQERGAEAIVFDPWAFHRKIAAPELRIIPATDVVRVLQRVAEGQAERVRFVMVSGRYLSIKADGWTLICGVAGGDLDGLYHCTTPDGEYVGLHDWSIWADPIDLLGDKTAWQIMQRYYRESRT